MPVYVDKLTDYGWAIRGRKYSSCHMFTSDEDLSELHAMALKIGMKLSWFQDHPKAPHYDLIASKRQMAIDLGAIEVDRHEAVKIWKARRELVSKKIVSK